MMGFGEAVASFYKNYFNFDGRASRAEYWWPTLLRTLVYVALIFAFVLSVGSNTSSDDFNGVQTGIFTAGILFLLANIIPKLSVSARRFHDLDQTGWLVLVFIIANNIIGLTWFAQMIWFAMLGTKGHNQYGPDPYGSNADVFG